MIRAFMRHPLILNYGQHSPNTRAQTLQQRTIRVTVQSKVNEMLRESMMYEPISVRNTL